MKRIIAIAGIIILTLGIFSCKNKEWSFPDFDYSTTYFPFQFPIRTLVFGDYYFDNTADKQLKFLISVNTGGFYENTQNISVNFVVDPTLTDSLYNSTTNTKISALPASYYTLSNTTNIVVPSGKSNGGVTVQLTDAFLNDSLTIGAKYVIPLRITGSTTDSVLSGRPNIPNPDPRIASNWVVPPMNYTLFAIRYVNEYHGTYLLRGKSEVRRTVEDTIIETVTYRKMFVEMDEVVSLPTVARNDVNYENSIRLSTGSPGKFEMKLVFDASGNAVITSTPKYSAVVSGTGKYSKGTEEWGGIDRNAIYMNYTVVEGTRTHRVMDTLVFRDKNVKFEEFVPLIKPTI
jgi:hypothetical protein